MKQVRNKPTKKHVVTKQMREPPKEKAARQRCAAKESQLSNEQTLSELQPVDAIFYQQIDGLLERILQECQEFAQAYNRVIGYRHLDVQHLPDGILVRFAESGGEVGFRFDRGRKDVSCYRHSGWADLGSSIVQHLPIALTIQDKYLRLVYDRTIVSEEDLVVRLLAELTAQRPPV